MIKLLTRMKEIQQHFPILANKLQEINMINNQVFSLEEKKHV